MKILPDKVRSYKRTPEFNEETLPAGLLKEHQTKAEVWGKIVILSGRLLYTIQHPFEEVTLDTSQFGVIEPAVVHHIKPLGSVSFYIEFYQ